MKQIILAEKPTTYLSGLHKGRACLNKHFPKDMMVYADYRMQEGCT